MNRIGLVIMLILLAFRPSVSFGQDSLTAARIFAKGIEQYNKNHFDSAIILFKEITDNNMARGTSIFGNALYNIPTIYWQMSQPREAKMWYLKVLASDVQDNDETGSIMEPHANYKYKSAVSMANISALDSNYSEMLKWLYQADTVYPYWGFEGSATNTNQRQAYLLNSKVMAMEQLGKKQEAIREIITTVLYSASESYFDASIERLKELTVNTGFIDAFDSGMDRMTVATTDSITWIAKFDVAGLPYKLIFSKAIPDKDVPHFRHVYYTDKDVMIDKRAVIALIKRMGFYKAMQQ